MSSTNPSRRQSDQRGVASLLFSLVMVIVISLIVLAFAQLARRGQRETLDSQLSTQAYYAAESGINDATNAVLQMVAANVDANTTGCDITANHKYDSYIDSTPLSSTDGTVRYTCLKVNTKPTSLVADLTTNASKVLTIQPNESGTTTLTISWTRAPNNTKLVGNCPNAGSIDLPPASSWECPFGVVRFDLVPTAGSLNRADLITKTMAVFAVPSNGGSTPGGVGYGGGVHRVPAHCDDTTCTITVSGLVDLSYGMRIMTKYLPTKNLKITGVTGGNTTHFVNGQAIIDATGQAQDVLRRIQVRLPLDGSHGGYADYAIGSQGSICKRFAVADGFYQDDASNSADNCPAAGDPQPTP